MTVGISTANVANGWLNTLRNGGNFSANATPFVKLHVGDPGSAGANNAAAGSTTRVALTQAAASGGSIAENGTAPVWTNTGATETISHISVWDSSSAGNFWYSVALTVSQPWVNTNTFTLNTCTVSLSPLAA